MISHSSIIRFVFAGLIAGLALPLWASTEREAWYKERGDKVERVLSNPNENTVRDLIEEFSGMEYHLKKSSDEYRALYEDMRQPLAGVSWLPGYLRDRILKARAELEAADEETRTGRYYNTMAKEGRGFGILRQLKTPESIKVLGEFLTDHRGAYDPNADEDTPGRRQVFRLLSNLTRISRIFTNSRVGPRRNHSCKFVKFVSNQRYR